jgi:hypothetical protein
MKSVKVLAKVLLTITFSRKTKNLMKIKDEGVA